MVGRACSWTVLSVLLSLPGQPSSWPRVNVPEPVANAAVRGALDEAGTWLIGRSKAFERLSEEVSLPVTLETADEAELTTIGRQPRHGVREVIARRRELPTVVGVDRRHENRTINCT